MAASLIGVALVIQLAADPSDTTAALQATPAQVPVPVPHATIAEVAIPEPASTTESPIKAVSLGIQDGTESYSPPVAPQVAVAPVPDEALDVPQISPAADQLAADANRWVTHKVKPGESLALIFQKQGLSAQLLYQITSSSEEAAALARIKPGQTLRFGFDSDNELHTLEHVVSPIQKLRITANGDTYSAQVIHKDLEVRTASAHGTISDSLFVDGQAAGLSDGQIMELAGIFGWDIDFALELRKGDSFSLVYQEQYLDGKKFRNGPILAAEFVNRGTSFRAIRFEDAEGNVGYYDTDGSSKRRAFIRTPVKFARISSGFSPKRWHPILKKWRSHKGVDYAAPSGTPIKATGAGRVVFRGWKGGYGNAVIIQHGGKYTTLYGHMSRFASNVKSGSRVKQGQIIGYVGQTGLASGPHLHYEFRVNGVHRNPLTVKLPKSLPLPKAQLAEFRKDSAPLLAKLDALAPATVMARADTTGN